MNSDEYRKKHPVFYVFYIIVNVLTFAAPWFWSNVIAYGVSKSNDKVVEAKPVETKPLAKPAESKPEEKLK